MEWWACYSIFGAKELVISNYFRNEPHVCIIGNIFLYYGKEYLGFQNVDYPDMQLPDGDAVVQTTHVVSLLSARRRSSSV